MYNITNQQGHSYRLRIDITKSEGVLQRTEYKNFIIDKESRGYRITSGTIDLTTSNATDHLDKLRFVQHFTDFIKYTKQEPPYCSLSILQV